MANDLNTVMPEPVKLTVRLNEPDGAIREEEITVGHIYMEDLQKTFKVVGQFMPEIKAMIGRSEGIVKAVEAKDGAEVKRQALNPALFFFEHTDVCMELISILQKRPIEWVKKLEVDSAIELFVLLVMENISFFIQKVLPSLSRATVHLGVVKNAFAPPAGQTSSKS